MRVRSGELRSLRPARALLLLGLSCAARQPAAPEPSAHTAFGGQRAEFGETPSGASVSQGVGRCQNVPALDRDPLLADFEQDSIFLRPVPQRYGVWFLGNDGSPEGKQEPESFAAERGGFAGSNYALHYKAQGFSEWGSVLGFVLRYTPEDGIRCPFNAAAFDGLSFMARGQGRIRVNLSTPEITPSNADNPEGRCQKGCWDTHGSFVFLQREWTEHRVLWSSLAQQGWGTIARLNLNEVLSINFAVGRADQPAELWLDDVKFLPHGAALGVAAK